VYSQGIPESRRSCKDSIAPGATEALLSRLASAAGARPAARIRRSSLREPDAVLSVLLLRRAKAGRSRPARDNTLRLSAASQARYCPRLPSWSCRAETTVSVVRSRVSDRPCALETFALSRRETTEDHVLLKTSPRRGVGALPLRGRGDSPTRQTRAANGDAVDPHSVGSLTSRSVLSRARSFVVARRMARSIMGAVRREKPDGLPRLRNVIRVADEAAGSQV